MSGPPRFYPTANSSSVAANNSIPFYPSAPSSSSSHPHPHTQPMSIPGVMYPSSSSIPYSSSTGGGNIRATKLESTSYRSTMPAARIPFHTQRGFAASQASTSNESTGSVSSSPMASTAFRNSPISPQRTSPTHSRSNIPPPSLHSQASASVQQEVHPVAPAANSTLTFASSSPIRSHSHSLPTSIPAFRRAVSFVGRDQGFDLFASDLEQIGTPKPASSVAKQQPPRIMGQLGQQLRQHLQSSPQPPILPSVSLSSSTFPSMTDADPLPSPVPGSNLQFAFELEPLDHTPENESAQPAGLNFDDVHLNSKDQILGAIPMHPHTPPKPSFAISAYGVGDSQTHPTSSRWSQLSSSAPSNIATFRSLHGPVRRDSTAGSIASGTSPLQPTSRKSSLIQAIQRRADDVQTPTTIASEGGIATEQDFDGEEDDEIDNAEVEGLVSTAIHNEGSPCSLSPCSSCSAESSDFSANLEDDFDVSLTFGPPMGHRFEEDEMDHAIKNRLNAHKREHHLNRHLHHRRRKVRLLLRQRREEARMRELASQADEWQTQQPVNEDDQVTVGSYTNGERQRKIQRYQEKKQRRVWSKKILYSCRKNFADKRPRVGGRFVKIHDDSNTNEAYPESFSLGTSPAGFHAFAQHMHGSNNAYVTAFSLPQHAYTHTNFSPTGTLDQQQQQQQQLHQQTQQHAMMIGFHMQHAAAVAAAAANASAGTSGVQDSSGGAQPDLNNAPASATVAPSGLSLAYQHYLRMQQHAQSSQSAPAPSAN